MEANTVLGLGSSMDAQQLQHAQNGAARPSSFIQVLKSGVQHKGNLSGEVGCTAACTVKSGVLYTEVGCTAQMQLGCTAQRQLDQGVVGTTAHSRAKQSTAVL
jgi:hypothetical protein